MNMLLYLRYSFVLNGEYCAIHKLKATRAMRVNIFENWCIIIHGSLGYNSLLIEFS